MAEQNLDELDSSQEWQRISPIAIIYFIVQAIKGLAGNFIYILPAFAVGFAKVKENPSVWLPLLTGLVVLAVISALLQYWFFSFRLAQDTIEIRSGVLAKKHLNLPFQRIQNVTLEQPIYYRPNQSVCMILDTAGSATQEAKIVAIPMANAESLKKQIVNQRKPNKELDAAENYSAVFQSERVLNRRSLKDLIIHGITNNRVWIIVAVLAPIYDDMASYLVSGLDYLGIDLQHYFDAQTQTVWQLALAFLSLVFIGAFSVGVVSVLGSIIMFYDFTLSKNEDRYIRRSGLFTKQEITMRLSRLQVFAAKQDWLDVLLGRINLELKQNNAGVVNPNDGAQSNKIIVPSVTHNEANEIALDALPYNHIYTANYQSISRRFIARQCLLWVLPICAIIAFASFVNDTMLGYFIAPSVFALLMLLVWCRWKRWGFASDDTFICIRKGVLGVDYYCFPIYKVQQTRYSQSLFMKRNELANIQFVLASGAIGLPFIPQQYAKDILENGLIQVSKQKRSWM